MLEKDLLQTLFRQVIPVEILESFIVVDFDESKEDEVVIILEEKEGLIPDESKDLVQNGFLNPIELTHYPLKGRECYLRLKRRRWKLRGGVSNENFFNNYDFTIQGTKVTKEFGAFLKENGL